MNPLTIVFAISLLIGVLASSARAQLILFDSNEYGQYEASAAAEASVNGNTPDEDTQAGLYPSFNYEATAQSSVPSAGAATGVDTFTTTLTDFSLSGTISQGATAQAAAGYAAAAYADTEYDQYFTVGTNEDYIVTFNPSGNGADYYFYLWDDTTNFSTPIFADDNQDANIAESTLALTAGDIYRLDLSSDVAVLLNRFVGLDQTASASEAISFSLVDEADAPEPSTWVMVPGSFCLLGLLLRNSPSFRLRSPQS